MFAGLLTCAVIGAPMIGISLLLARLGYIRTGGPADGLLSTVYIAGFLCSAIALRRLRVTGRGNAGKLISGIQIAGLVMAEVWAVLTAMGSPPAFRSLLALTDYSWPFSHVFMLVVGVAAWRAKVWNGWPLYMLFFCGFALPLSIGLQQLFGDLVGILAFGILTATPLTVVALTSNSKLYDPVRLSSARISVGQTQ